MEHTLSVIIPVYTEEESVKILYEKIRESIEPHYAYEVIFIDDGSTDASVQKIKEMIQEDSRVHLLVFRKNFGKAAALQAGFRNAVGDIIVTMDWRRAMIWCQDGRKSGMTRWKNGFLPSCSTE